MIEGCYIDLSAAPKAQTGGYAFAGSPHGLVIAHNTAIGCVRGVHTDTPGSYAPKAARKCDHQPQPLLRLCRSALASAPRITRRSATDHFENFTIESNDIEMVRGGNGIGLWGSTTAFQVQKQHHHQESPPLPRVTSIGREFTCLPGRRVTWSRAIASAPRAIRISEESILTLMRMRHRTRTASKTTPGPRKRSRRKPSPACAPRSTARISRFPRAAVSGPLRWAAPRVMPTRDVAVKQQSGWIRSLQLPATVPGPGRDPLRPQHRARSRWQVRSVCRQPERRVFDRRRLDVQQLGIGAGPGCPAGDGGRRHRLPHGRGHAGRADRPLCARPP